MAKKGFAHSTISNEEFVAMWQSAPDLNTVNESYDLGSTSAQGRASRLRKLGVELKKFPRGKTDIDIDALNKIAKKSSKV